MFLTPRCAQVIDPSVKLQTALGYWDSALALATDSGVFETISEENVEAIQLLQYSGKHFFDLVDSSTLTGSVA